MKKLNTILLTLILAASVFPCGAPTIITGQVDAYSPATVTLYNRENLVVEQVRSSHFGYFAFENVYTECDAPITVRVHHKYLLFESAVLEDKEFDGFIFRFIGRIGNEQAKRIR